MQTGTAMAHMFARRFDVACEWAEKACTELPNILRVSASSAASYALAGRMDEARRAMEHVRRIDADAAHLQTAKIGCRAPATGRSGHVCGRPAASRSAGIARCGLVFAAKANAQVARFLFNWPSPSVF